MLREGMAERLDSDPLFDWRGKNVSRIEGLSDIVFALALGMVVSTSSTPVTLSDLSGHLLSIFPVAAAFIMLLEIWNAHFVFFRRYGLTDRRIVLINACLLLVVMFYAYPLRFVFDGLFAFIFALLGNPDLVIRMDIQFQDTGLMMAYFAIGYAAAYTLIGLMYYHALRKAERLSLDSTELILTKRSIGTFVVRVLCAILVVALALLTPLQAFSGFLLFLFFPLRALMRRKYKIPKSEKVVAEDPA